MRCMGPRRAHPGTGSKQLASAAPMGSRCACMPARPRARPAHPPHLPCHALVQAATTTCGAILTWGAAAAPSSQVARAPRAPTPVRMPRLLGAPGRPRLLGCAARLACAALAWAAPAHMAAVSPRPGRSRQQHVVGHPRQPAHGQGGTPAAARVRLRATAQLCGHHLRCARWGRPRHCLQGVPAPLPPLPRVVHQDNPLARGAAAAGGGPAAKGPVHGNAAHAPRAAGPASRAGGGEAGRLSRRLGRRSGRQLWDGGTATRTIFCTKDAYTASPPPTHPLLLSRHPRGNRASSASRRS